MRQAHGSWIKVGLIKHYATGEAIDIKSAAAPNGRRGGRGAGWRRLGFESRTAMLKKAIEAMLA